MTEGARDAALGGGIGLIAGAALGALIVLLSGPPYQMPTGVAAGAAGGLLYGVLFGVTACSTRCRSHHRRRRSFILARLPFLFAVCLALLLLPGAMQGLLSGPGEHGERHAAYSPLTILLGILLAVYVGFLWVRILRRGHG